MEVAFCELITACLVEWNCDKRDKDASVVMTWAETAQACDVSIYLRRLHCIIDSLRFSILCLRLAHHALESRTGVRYSINLSWIYDHVRKEATSADAES